MEIKYRVVSAETAKFVQGIPFEVPEFVKMLFRKEEWKPWNDKLFETKKEVVVYRSSIGCFAPVRNKNSYAFDIEEVATN